MLRSGIPACSLQDRSALHAPGGPKALSTLAKGLAGFSYRINFRKTID